MNNPLVITCRVDAARIESQLAELNELARAFPDAIDRLLERFPDPADFFDIHQESRPTTGTNDIWFTFELTEFVRGFLFALKKRPLL